MDMGDNAAAPQRFHGIHEDVPRYRLHDVLNELGTIAFKPLPFLRAFDTHICHAVAAELILADPRLYIGKLSAGRKGENDKK